MKSVVIVVNKASPKASSCAMFAGMNILDILQSRIVGISLHADSGILHNHNHNHNQPSTTSTSILTSMPHPHGILIFQFIPFL
mmetsp:Transcript_29069/g.49528  ORF Transcript_29069/g.49528 Transcript_29069/m.49528 type:complete len:83 (-) Transcript_29069:193-441(-)